MITFVLAVLLPISISWYVMMNMNQKQMENKIRELMAVSYTHSDAADERSSVDLGGRRIIKKKKKKKIAGLGGKTKQVNKQSTNQAAR